MIYRYYPVFRKQNMYRYDISDPHSCISFLCDDSPVSYDSFLVNAFHHSNTTLQKMTNMVELDEINIIGDSGGFQIMTGKTQEPVENLRPVIFKWLEENCSYSMILDVPPVLCDYETAFKQTFDNCDYFYNNQSGKTRFINIIHGNSYSEINKWIDKITEYKFNGGYAIGGLIGNPNKIYKTLMTLCILYKRDILEKLDNQQLLHILGETKYEDMLLSMYFLNRIKNLRFILSTDGKFNIDISRRNLFHSRFFRLCVESPKMIPFKKLYDSGYRCNCPVCSNDTLYYGIKTGVINPTDFIYAHNHNIILFLFNEVFKISKLPYDVLKFYFKKEYLVKLKAIDEITADKETCIDILKKYSFVFRQHNMSKPLF